MKTACFWPVSLLAAVFLTAGTLAFAADTGVRTQYFYQPPAGTQYVQASELFTDLSLSFGTTSSGGNVDIKTTQEALTFERSFSSVFSAGATFAYSATFQNILNLSSSGNSTNTNFSTGIDDPQVYVKILFPLDDASFFAALLYDFSPGPSIQSDANYGAGNSLTGGAFVTPTLGFQGRVSPASVLGAAIAYQNNFGDSFYFVSGKPAETVSGGNLTSFAVFYEFQSPRFVADVTFSLANRDGESSSISQSSGSNNYPPITGQTTLAQYGATLIWIVNPSWQVIARFNGYTGAPTTFTTPGATGTNSSFISSPLTQNQYVLAARFLF